MPIPAFDFDDFARRVYLERPSIHREPFLLPALYGGEAHCTYDALFVFQDPSESFTESRWRPCANAADAVQMHRAIFEEWASRGKAALLFHRIDDVIARSSSTGANTTRSFFSRYYITDIWKDARWKGRDRKHREYWLSKLAIELRGASARRVVLVSQQARKGRHLVPNGVPIHTLPFPSQWISTEAFAAEVERLVNEMFPSTSPSSASTNAS